MSNQAHSDPLIHSNFDYCSGCSHSRLHLLIAETIELHFSNAKIIGVSSPGCSQEISKYFKIPFIQAPPGKAPAIAAGIKKGNPDAIVFTYQGDGDLYSSGADTLLHAALRSEKITIFCLNNLTMASPGGQLSPTSKIGQITATTPLGRSSSKTGYPLNMVSNLAKFPGVSLAQRIALHEPDYIKQALIAIKDGFSHQESGSGLSIIEALGMCPTYWNNPPILAKEQIDNAMITDFPLGIFYRETLKQ